MGSVDGDEIMQGPIGSEEKIFVSVRLRPLNEREISRNDLSDWECINDNSIIFRNSFSIPDRSYPTAYTFDRVFRCDCPTRKVYEEGAKEVALSVVGGINSTIFAYGQTSSGKTYTMTGITEHTVEDIYGYIEKHVERRFNLKLSAIEIYNESIKDLLCADNTPLRLLDDPERGTIVEKLTEEPLRDMDHFKQLLSVCESQRQTGETYLNEASSRSHQIIRLTIESSACQFLGNDKSSSLTAAVNFVDLAGSERASQALSAGARLKEGCHINRSLLTLGTVIRKLSNGKNAHIPYRDSKLTRILQPSLGGNARTAIICTICPAMSHVEQSRNTLLFASSAKDVRTNAQVNVVVSDKALVKHLQNELEKLRCELKSAGQAALMSDSGALLREKDRQIKKLKEEVKELQEQRDLAQFEVKDLLKMVGGDKSSVALAGLHDSYPELRVQTQDYENQLLNTTALSDSHCPDVSVRSFDASQSSDGPRSSIDENFNQLFSSEESFPRFKSSAQLSDRAPNFATMERQFNQNLEDHCKEVRCIETEESIVARCIDSNLSDFSPTGYPDSNISSPIENTATSGLTVVENAEKDNCELPTLKKVKGSSKYCPIFVIPSPDKLSPWILEQDEYEALKLTRSKSSKARLMTTSSSEKLETNKIMEQSWRQEYFTRQPNDLENELAPLNFVGLNEELKRQNVYTPTDDKFTSTNTPVAGTEKMDDLQSGSQLLHVRVRETKSKSVGSADILKDMGFEPDQNDQQWPSEFRKLQKEIIELWHACNISLVHRTYFFLLFTGDSTDSIYMEVELRRLSFLRDIFSQGNHTVEDGQSLNPATSMKALRSERQMLSNQMKRRFSKHEREILFLEWDIDLSSNQRRMQLTNQLWTCTKSMEHIRKSADTVSKIVGYVEPEQAFKEMFGLYFTPRKKSQTSFRWRPSVKALL